MHFQAIIVTRTNGQQAAVVCAPVPRLRLLLPALAPGCPASRNVAARQPLRHSSK